MKWPVCTAREILQVDFYDTFKSYSVPAYMCRRLQISGMRFLWDIAAHAQSSRRSEEFEEHQREFTLLKGNPLLWVHKNYTHKNAGLIVLTYAPVLALTGPLKINLSV